MKTSNKGFRKTSSFVNQLTKKSFEKRGFSHSKLLTHWKEIVGFDLFQISKPVKMSSPKGDLGTTLMIEIDGAFGPELNMQKKMIIEKVNQVYGYSAVAKIRFISSADLGYNFIPAKTEKKLKNVEKNQSGVVEKKFREISKNLTMVKHKKLQMVLSKISRSFAKNQS